MRTQPLASVRGIAMNEQFFETPVSSVWPSFNQKLEQTVHSWGPQVLDKAFAPLRDDVDRLGLLSALGVDHVKCSIGAQDERLAVRTALEGAEERARRRNRAEPRDHLDQKVVVMEEGVRRLWDAGARTRVCWEPCEATPARRWAEAGGYR